MKDAWTIAELRSELLRFEAELRAAGKAARTIHTYVDRAERFLRWLVGDYDPRDRSTGPHTDRTRSERP